MKMYILVLDFVFFRNDEFDSVKNIVSIDSSKDFVWNLDIRMASLIDFFWCIHLIRNESSLASFLCCSKVSFEKYFDIVPFIVQSLGLILITNVQ